MVREGHKMEINLVTLVLLVLSVVSYTSSQDTTGNTFSDCIRHIARPRSCKDHNTLKSYRSFDGTCTNLKHRTIGAINTPFRRLVKRAYVDKKNLGIPRGFPGTKPEVPPPNKVSQSIFSVRKSNKGNDEKLAVIFMTIGQFLDHDMVSGTHGPCSVTNCNSRDAFNYPCFPMRFKKDGARCTPFARSQAICPKNQKTAVREQVNTFTSFIDGSHIYGNNAKRARLLRSFRLGKLKVRKGNLLPIAPRGVSCNPVTSGAKGRCSIAGDPRADENIALHAMHTIWVREHNHVAGKLAKRHPRWGDNKLYQEARKIVIAEWQHIVFNEWLPNIVKLPNYRNYNSHLDPRIANAFAGAAFRFGHSLVPNEFTQLNKNYDRKHRPISLRDSFFNINSINIRGIEPTIFGMVGNQSKTVDTKFSFNLARRLFVKPGRNEHMDLTAFNIQRGRDHGLPTYGKWRNFCKLGSVRNFAQLKRFIPGDVVDKLSKIYKKPDQIDLFAAGISEKHARKSIVGPTFRCIMRNQFLRLRDGDRFYFENPGVFNRAQRNQIKRVTLARILCNNVKKIVSVNREALFQTKKKRTLCSRIKKINFSIF